MWLVKIKLEDTTNLAQLNSKVNVVIMKLY